MVENSDQMAGVIRTNAAASMLGVSPNTLRSWERRFEFPQPRRTSGGHRQYDLAEIEALRSALEEAHNISSAISMAKERGTGPATPSRLASALGRFDEDAADRILEESLAVRSVERTVSEVLLPGVAETGNSMQSAEYGFAWRFATRWMSATLRVSPPASRDECVVVFDAGASQQPDALQAQALELVLRRAGLRTLTLGAELDQARLTHALAAVEPAVVVLAGNGASLDALGRLVYAARRVGGDAVQVMNFCSAERDTGASTVTTLSDAVLDARDEVLAAVERPHVKAQPRFAKAAVVSK
jgi:DNA-binding transcriptional MerR regulator